jgi:DNA-binding MarR family transcriptional regulator
VTATVGAVDTDEAIRSINESFERLVLGARRYARRAAGELAEDLPPAAWPVFREVLRCERVQAGTIVHALGMDKSAVSRHIKELREHGLLEAERDEHDARAWWLTVPPEARARMASIAAGQQERLRAQLASWEPEDLERFAVLLDRFSTPAAGD